MHIHFLSTAQESKRAECYLKGMSVHELRLTCLAARWADHVGHTAAVRPAAAVAPELTHDQGILPGVVECAWVSTLPDAYPASRGSCPKVPPWRPAEGCYGPYPVSLDHACIKLSLIYSCPK